MLLAFQGKAMALTFMDTVIFPTPTIAADERSGTAIDWTYAHSLEEISWDQITLTGGSLSLTHKGNPNEGPQREIWHALTSSGLWIGELGESETVIREDVWELSKPVLLFLSNGKLSSLEIGLSEQTAYNGEKIELFGSVLRLDYQLRTPLSPEPSGLVLLALGMAGKFFRGSRVKKPSGEFTSG